MTGGQRFLMAGNGIRLFRGTCAYFIFSSWRALRARASGLELGASVRSAAGGAYSGLCTQGQGETSIYCTARSSKKEGGSDSRWRPSATCTADLSAGRFFEVSLSRPCSSLPKPWTFDGILPHIVRGSMGRLVFLDSRPCIYAAGLPVFRST